MPSQIFQASHQLGVDKSTIGQQDNLEVEGKKQQLKKYILGLLHLDFGLLRQKEQRELGSRS